MAEEIVRQWRQLNQVERDMDFAFTLTASPKPLPRPVLKLPEHGVALALSKRVGWEDG